MRRREFIAITACTAATWPLTARAQQERVRRIGVLMDLAADQAESQVRVSAFELQKLGGTDGDNVRIDIRWGTDNADDSRRFAVELAALTPDIIPSGSAAVAPAHFADGKRRFHRIVSRYFARS